MSRRLKLSERTASVSGQRTAGRILIAFRLSLLATWAWRWVCPLGVWQRGESEALAFQSEDEKRSGPWELECVRLVTEKETQERSFMRLCV